MADREMIMRCAKAIFELEQEQDYTQYSTNPIMYGIEGKVSWEYISDTEKVVASILNGYVSQALAVISAMKEPTDKMCMAVMTAAATEENKAIEYAPKQGWKAMIEAILK